MIFLHSVLKKDVSELPKILFGLIALFLVMSCTGKVNTETSIASAVESMAAQNSVSLISNSTQSQNKCEVGNTVVIQVALSSIAQYYCRDLSTLMDSVKLGPICSGGISIQALKVDGSAKDCHQLTICGKTFDSKIDITKRIDGTTVQQLTFSNLPWGCEGRIEASTSSSFDTPDTQKVSFQVLPPSCPFCQASNGVTCNACASATDSTFIAGQMIPNTCTGGCKSCAYPPPNSPSASIPGVSVVQVNHAGIGAFYTTANAVCGQTCNQVQQIRVCNNGAWVAGSDVSFSTQCQEPSSSSCSAGPHSVSQVMSQISTSIGSAFNMSGVTRRSFAAAFIPTCIDCQAGKCATCKAASGADGFILYSQASVANGVNCSTVSQCKTCVNGLFQGDPTFNYNSCSSLSASCNQKLLSAAVPSGSSQIFYNGGACDPISLQCLDGNWNASGAAVSQALADSYTLTCIKAVDCKTSAGIPILNGASLYVFDTALVDSTDNCYSASHYRYLSCASGSVAPSDPGVTFSFKTCTTKKCVDPRDSSKTINAGTTVSYWSVAPPNCSALPSPQAYCDNNKITITCPASGGTATVSPASATNLSSFTNNSCVVPTSCTGCVFNKTDATNISVAFDGTITLFKVAASDLCQGVGKLFKCQQGVNGAAPFLLDTTGASEKDSVYPYLNCSPTGGADQGNLGGTGGGTGNDNGPGAALKKRFGGGDGSGGGGLGCVDATICPAHYSKASQPFTVLFNPCLLPWPGRIGEIEFYGSIIAFSSSGLNLASGTSDTVCVTKPDTCSKHRQSRTCHYPNWTGTDDFKYPNCVEKTSCP